MIKRLILWMRIVTADKQTRETDENHSQKRNDEAPPLFRPSFHLKRNRISVATTMGTGSQQPKLRADQTERKG